MLGVKADCGGDWGERVERIGGGEELGGGAEREHAPRVALRSRWTATGTLRPAAITRRIACAAPLARHVPPRLPLHSSTARHGADRDIEQHRESERISQRVRG